MTDVLRKALTALLSHYDGEWTAEHEQRQILHMDLLWKLVRKDYHGVADCAMDLRELHL